MITVVVNQKGGVGKTTCTAALGGVLAEQCRCLVIDLDPQGNLTTALGVQIQDQPTIYHVLLEKVAAREAILKTPQADLLAADIALAKAESELLGVVGNSFILRECLESIQSDYDQILIDCPPSLGLLTLNGLTCADWVLIPVQCQFFALKGVSALMDTITNVQRRLNPRLQILGVLPTMADRTMMSQDVLTSLKRNLQGIKIFPAVKRSTRFAESNLAGEPIHRYATEAPELSYPYRHVAEHLLA